MPRYMTKEGYQAIRDEIDHLWSVERPDVVDQVSRAAELGDRSENAEYIYGKRRLREIDSRMRYLQLKLDDVVVVDLAEQVTSKDIKFGAVVTVLDDEGDEKTWRLVDQDESDPKRGRISVQSPIGKALLGKKVGDSIDVELPKGRVSYEVTSIRYGAGTP
jgi:transcription elongation factor GreB